MPNAVPDAPVSPIEPAEPGIDLLLPFSGEPKANGAGLSAIRRPCLPKEVAGDVAACVPGMSPSLLTLREAERRQQAI